MHHELDRTSRTWRFFHAMVTRRRTSLVVVLAFTAVAGFLASGVKPDYSVEMGFPTFHKSRANYEDYKASFPGDDVRALLVVEAPDLFTPAGIGRVEALEDDLATLTGVLDTEGLTTSKDIVGEDGMIALEPLFPPGDVAAMSAEEIARRRQVATSDPLFAWNLAPPDGRAVIIRVNLAPDYVATEANRTAFLRAARELVERHRLRAEAAGVAQKLTLSGIPVTRSQYTELVTSDLHRMFPFAFVLTLALLFVVFRRLRDVFVAWATIVCSVVWTVGAMGLMGFPLQMLTQITPIVVMIISISDTVHIVAHYREALARGASVREAVAESCALNTWPCFLTEVTIAGGFIALLGNDMVMIQQFGLVTAVGMLLTWLANVTVLPVLLSLFRARHGDRRAVATGGGRHFAGFIGVVSRIVTRHGRRVFAAAAVVVAIAAIAATQVGSEYYANSDLRPGSQLHAELDYVESVHGGHMPLVIHVKPPADVDGAGSPDPMLEPAALALIDRITHRLEADHEVVKNATSLAKLMRKAHRLFAGDDIADDRPLPWTRALAAQELVAIDDPATLRHVLSFDRREAAITVSMPDRGSTFTAETLDDIEAYLASEEAATGYQLTATGIYTLSDAVYEGLVGGLAASLGLAVLFSFLIFCTVLRSWRLGALALVPNLLPLLITVALMALLGIDLKPSTVILFSITLVIADDDTIQFLARFRRAFLPLARSGHPAPHRAAALATLRETGVPMLITSSAISLGFFVLLGSEFLALSHLGLLTGISLLAAVFADLFLSPLLLMTLRPRIGRDAGRLPRAAVVGALVEASDGN